MTTTRRLSLVIGAVALAAAGLVLLACYPALRENRQMRQNEARKSARIWLVCTRVNMDIISDALALYVRTNANSESVNLGMLVRSGLLPEWSEIYICPSWYRIEPFEKDYEETFRKTIFTPSHIAACYSNCSYYIESSPDKFCVRCRYHTNALNYTVPCGKSLSD